jgi:hypothetical protein
MICYILFSANGDLVQMGSVPDSAFLPNPTGGQQLVEVDELPDLPPNKKPNLVNGQIEFITIPEPIPQPSNYHVFDEILMQWVLTEAAAVEQVKDTRNKLLLASDWTQLADLSAETKALWEPYRQALRDVTDQPGYPYDVVWPTPPQ